MKAATWQCRIWRALGGIAFTLVAQVALVGAPDKAVQAAVPLPETSLPVGLPALHSLGEAMQRDLRTGLALEAQAWHLNLVIVSDASILFSAFLFAARSVEMFLRARRVMGAPPA